MTLFEECIAALKNYSIVEDNKLIDQILSNLNLTFYGKVDFSKYADSHEVSLNEIHMLSGEKEYYVIWTDAEIPIIKCNIDDILDNIDDVLIEEIKMFFPNMSKNLLRFRLIGNRSAK